MRSSSFKKIILTLIIAGTAGTIFSCGKTPAPFLEEVDAPLPDNTPGSSDPVLPEEDLGTRKVTGAAGLGSQCPYGTLSPIQNLPLELWSCPLALETVELIQPLQPFYLQADCKKKTLIVRSKDGRLLDSTWEIMPDHTFSIRVDGGKALLKSDGPNRGACAVSTEASLFGKIDCQDRDRVMIHLEILWSLGTSNVSANACTLPVPAANNTGCSFYTKIDMKQCD